MFSLFLSEPRPSLTTAEYPQCLLAGFASSAEFGAPHMESSPAAVYYHVTNVRRTFHQVFTPLEAASKGLVHVSSPCSSVATRGEGRRARPKKEGCWRVVIPAECKLLSRQSAACQPGRHCTIKAGEASFRSVMVGSEGVDDFPSPTTSDQLLRAPAATRGALQLYTLLSAPQYRSPLTLAPALSTFRRRGTLPDAFPCQRNL